MRRLLWLVLISVLLLSGCVMHDPWTHATMTTSIQEGMTRDQVKAAIGPPYRTSWSRDGGSIYETWQYRHIYQTHTMLGPAREYSQFRTIYLKDGKVIGMSQ